MGDSMLSDIKFLVRVGNYLERGANERYNHGDEQDAPLIKSDLEMAKRLGEIAKKLESFAMLPGTTMPDEGTAQAGAL